MVVTGHSLSEPSLWRPVFLTRTSINAVSIAVDIIIRISFYHVSVLNKKYTMLQGKYPVTVGDLRKQHFPQTTMPPSVFGNSVAHIKDRLGLVLSQ